MSKKDPTGRTGEVFWVYPFMAAPADPRFPRQFENCVSIDPLAGWLRVRVEGWGPSTEDAESLQSEVEALLSHGCLTGDCLHEKQSQCDRALLTTLKAFKERVDS